MKEKIEALIREIGINEVESVLNQMKSKVNVKENLKKDFIDLLTGCNMSFDDDAIEYRKDGNLLFFYQKNKNIFWIKYVIWSNFE
jgi:CO dehydrogenase nickel-insertion accessory protein CooC1